MRCNSEDASISPFNGRVVFGATAMGVGLGGLAWLVGWLMLAMIIGAGIYITMAILQQSAEWRPWQERIMRRLGR